MSSLNELRQENLIDLDEKGYLHLNRLMASWNLIADLAFSDLLIYVPSKERNESTGLPKYFYIGAQVRPSTAQTVFIEDLVGMKFDTSDVNLVLQAFASDAQVEGEIKDDSLDATLILSHVPIVMKGYSLESTPKVIGTLVKIARSVPTRRKGELESNYEFLANSFISMVASGDFPFKNDEAAIEEAPRVGDGLIILDRQHRVKFASPNARSALHHLGIHAVIAGKTFGELGLEMAALERSGAKRMPTLAEISGANQAVISLRTIPILSNDEIDSFVILLRDVTELKRRERELLSKEATIKEVHHRVKNNLQTISSLLSLQARRSTNLETKDALREAERRIRSIAVVHDILSRQGENVPFDKILFSLISLAEDSQMGQSRVLITKQGFSGDVPEDVATPLAVVISELLQNALKHAFKNSDDLKEKRVEIELKRESENLTVLVKDNGEGMEEPCPKAFTRSLGLSLIHDLVTTQLGGTVRIDTKKGKGTIIEITIKINLSQPN